MLLWHGFAADNTAAKQTVNNPRWEPCLYTKPLVSELINGVTSHFSDAILVAGSTHGPLDNDLEVHGPPHSTS